jgi:hypothetical protein
MAQKAGNPDKLILGAAVAGLGLIALYYLKAGYDRENAAFIPDSVENQIDDLVRTLNVTFGPNWVSYGAEYLKAYLRYTLPPGLVRLVDVVYQVELLARRGYIHGWTKRAQAIAMASV